MKRLKAKGMTGRERNKKVLKLMVIEVEAKRRRNQTKGERLLMV